MSELALAEWAVKQLRTCPFCGSAFVGIDGIAQTRGRCGNCGAQGPTGTSSGEAAIAAWNRRATQPAPDGERVAEYERRKQEYADLAGSKPALDAFVLPLLSASQPVGGELWERIALATAWLRCPEHGPQCGGEACCCTDRHRNETEIERMLAAAPAKPDALREAAEHVATEILEAAGRARRGRRERWQVT